MWTTNIETPKNHVLMETWVQGWRWVSRSRGAEASEVRGVALWAALGCGTGGRASDWVTGSLVFLLTFINKSARLLGHLESGNSGACIDLASAQIQVNQCFCSKSSFLYAYGIKIISNSCICRPVRCWLNRRHHDANSRISVSPTGPSPCPALRSSLSRQDL